MAVATDTEPPPEEVSLEPQGLTPPLDQEQLKILLALITQIWPTRLIPGLTQTSMAPRQLEATKLMRKHISYR